MSEDTDNVIKLVERDVADIPRMMESAAADIREGNLGLVVGGAAVFIRDDGTLEVFAWGSDQSEMNSIGLLTCGAQWLSRYRVAR